MEGHVNEGQIENMKMIKENLENAKPIDIHKAQNAKYLHAKSTKRK